MKKVLSQTRAPDGHGKNGARDGSNSGYECDDNNDNFSELGRRHVAKTSPATTTTASKNNREVNEGANVYQTRAIEHEGVVKGMAKRRKRSKALAVTKDLLPKGLKEIRQSRPARSLPQPPQQQEREEKEEEKEEGGKRRKRRKRRKKEKMAKWEK